MSLRSVVATFAFVSIGFSQDLPSFRWAKQLDASGLNNSVAGLGTDAQGNVYVVGTTSSSRFPVKNAVQPGMGSAGLYRISGAVSTALGLASCASLALDPQNPAQIYAASNGALMKSVDSGATFASVAMPAMNVWSIAIEPGNDQTLYAGTSEKGVLRSVDGGATWTSKNSGLPVQANGSIGVQNLWIDPTNVNVIIAATSNGIMRSADRAASWQPTTMMDSIERITFDLHDGAFYLKTYHRGLFRSTDHGQTFAAFTVPREIDEVFPDPIQPDRLIGEGTGLYQSMDGGVTWTKESATRIYNLVADPLNGVYYGLSQLAGIVRISGNLQSVSPVSLGLPSTSTTALGVVNGQVYAGSTGSTDVFVAKLDPAGNVAYSTYLGGSGYDQAFAMTVDAGGNVFVTGTTNSGDFPVSQGAYASSGAVFLTRLNPDGSLGYSTYFSGTDPVAVATDGSGSAWLLGSSSRNLPVTPGALSGTFCCEVPGPGVGPSPMGREATLTRFSPSGSSLTFSTYVPGSGIVSILGTEKGAAAFAIAADGSAYIGGPKGIFRIDATGSTLLDSTTHAPVNPRAMAFGPDGSLYVAGDPVLFKPGIGPVQPTPVGLVRMDPAKFSGPYLAAIRPAPNSQVKVLTVDASGNVYVGGSTGLSLPTRTPFAGAFAGPTGFLSKYSGDLSNLLFSGYFGDTNKFTVSGVGIGEKGDVLIAGVTNLTNNSPGQGDVWLNSLVLTPPPALRIDSVVNAASMIDGPLSSGETIFIQGAGFADNSQLLIGGVAVSPLSITSTVIAATVPVGLPAAAAAVEVRSGGISSNSVLMPVAVTSPGVFSQDGSGLGSAYILNKDGTLNTSVNPAEPGDRVTIFATGVGPMTFTQCCAETEYPVNVFINTLYCNGVAAIVGPVKGLPGDVYQITVYVPDSSRPPGAQSPVILEINGVKSQPVTISMRQ